MKPTAPDIHPSDPPLVDAIFLRLPAVKRLTGLGRSTFYGMVARHEFPAQVKLGARAVGWRRSDIERWSETR
jgi:prophage regulatory protein